MKFLRFLPLFLLVFCASELHAEIKIGVIDTNKIIESCTAHAEAKKVIENEFNKYEKEFLHNMFYNFNLEYCWCN